MTSNDEYLGPRAIRTSQDVEAVRARVRRWITERASEIHREGALAWAADDVGHFPDRSDADRQAAEEMAVLLRGLGEWAAVPSERLPHADPVPDHLWYPFR